MVLAVVGTEDVLAIGQELLLNGADNLQDGGFWIWDFNSEDEFYSPKFRKVLGFSGEIDFPSHESSWRNQIFKEDLERVDEIMNVLINENKDINYDFDVSYYTKKNKVLKVNCSGLIFKKNGLNKYLIGSHTILK